MSILDTFTIMFNSNADAVKKGAAEATQAGKTLEEQLGQTGTKGVEAAHKIEEGNSKLSESFDKVREHANTMAETLIEHALEVAVAFKALFEVEKMVDNFFEQAEITDQLGEQARSLGLNVEEMDAWGQATVRVGGSAEAFGSTLENLGRQLERIAITGKSRMLPFLQQLHLGLKDANGQTKTAFELLGEIPKAIEKMPKAQSAGILRGIGLDSGTIRLLQSGSKEVEELIKRQKELGNITEHDTEVAEAFNRKWDDMKQLFRNITVESDTGLLPLLGDLLDKIIEFVEFLREHKDLVIGFFIGTAAAVIVLGDAFGILGGILAIVFSPVTLIIVAILAIAAAFALVYDDMKGFLEGSKSVTGELAKQWPIVGEAVRGFARLLGEAKDFIIDSIQSIVDWVKRIPEGFRQWGEIFEAAKGYVSGFIDYCIAEFEKMPGPVKDILKLIATIIKDTVEIFGPIFEGGFKVILAVVKAGVEGIGAILHLIGDLIVDPEHAFQNFWARLKQIFAELVGGMPDISKTFEDVGHAIMKVGEDIIALFKRVWGEIGWIIDKIAGVVGGVGGAIGKGLGAAGHMIAHPSDWVNGRSSASPSGAVGAPATPLPLPGELHGDIGAGQGILASANSPLMAQTSTSLSSSTARTEVHNNNSIGAINVTTAPGADGHEIADILADHLRQHYNEVIPNYADGVSH